MSDFLNIYIFIIISLIISSIIILLSYILAVQKQDNEKVSAYECGFSPYDEARSRFDIKFYLVSILFIIFDIEVIYLVPYTMTASVINVYGFISILLFIIILTVGFAWEWISGALNWS